MQFIVIAKDGTGSGALQRRMAAREAHVALGNEMRDRGSRVGPSFERTV